MARLVVSRPNQTSSLEEKCPATVDRIHCCIGAVAVAAVYAHRSTCNDSEVAFLARKVIKDQLRVWMGKGDGKRKGGDVHRERDLIYHLVIFTASANLGRFLRGF